jgi:HD-GYP domain-containing protein (c-di-GMP phosphodiesterase class II)
MDTPWSYLLPADAAAPVHARLTALQDHRGGHDILLHAGRVATQAARLGLALRLPTSVIEEAILVGWLHEVAADPDGTTETTAVLAAEHALRPLPGLLAVSRSVRCLTERWDGRGGPDGLWETQIPLATRIVAVADGLDRLLHGCPERGAVASYVAADWLRRESGRHFDPVIADVALAMLVTPADLAGSGAGLA